MSFLVGLREGCAALALHLRPAPAPAGAPSESPGPPRPPVTHFLRDDPRPSQPLPHLGPAFIVSGGDRDPVIRVAAIAGGARPPARAAVHHG